MINLIWALPLSIFPFAVVAYELRKQHKRKMDIIERIKKTKREINTK